MSISLDATELRDRLKRLEQSFPEALEEAVAQEMVGVYREMMPRIPKDTGALRESAYVERSADGNVEVGVAQSYGIFVHERTELHHPIGEAKFLENAWNFRKPGMEERIRRRVYADVNADKVTPADKAPGNRGEIPRTRQRSGSRYAPGRRPTVR